MLNDMQLQNHQQKNPIKGIFEDIQLLFNINSFNSIIRLASRQSSLEASIKSKLNQTQKLEEKLSRLRPALEQLRVSSLSLEEFFDAPLDWEREQHKLAALLPR